MRRVRIDRVLNKRLLPSTSGAPLPEPLQPNDVVTVVEEIQGEPVTPGNTIWFRTDQNFVIYSGGTSPVVDTPSLSWAVLMLDVNRIWSEFSELGAKARIAVLDSGTTDDVDFSGRLTFHDVIDKSDVPIDEDGLGHGTSCCGIIAGASLGVAPEASLLSVRVMKTRNSPTAEKLAEGIEWALTRGDIDVMSISISLVEIGPALQTAINKALGRGITVIAASGNFEGAADFFPAAVPGVISVGSVDKALKKMLKSADSTQLDLLAPGLELPTTKAGNSTGSFSGTSAATAYVAGCFALFRSYIKEHKLTINRGQLENIVKADAIPYPPPTSRAKSGFGIINPFKTIESLKNTKK